MHFRGPMDTLECILTRHSCRQYIEKEIPMDDIKRILEAAIAAPSGKMDSHGSLRLF